VGPLVARRGVEPLHDRARVVEGEERKPGGDVDGKPRFAPVHVRPTAQRERRAGLRVEQRPAAASFTGWWRARCRALRSPEMGCSTAAGPPTINAMARARRWNALSGSLRSSIAWIPATAKPVAA